MGVEVKHIQKKYLLVKAPAGGLDHLQLESLMVGQLALLESFDCCQPLLTIHNLVTSR
jgi:hypothetical protein